MRVTRARSRHLSRRCNSPRFGGTRSSRWAASSWSQADLDREGIPGDRVVHVEDARGRVVTSRSRPALLLHRSAAGRRRGAPRRWARLDLPQGGRRDLRGGGGKGPAWFATTAWTGSTSCRCWWPRTGRSPRWGYDRRRFRPNLLIRDVPGLAERQWEGRHLHVGRAVIRMVSLRQRCIMTTFDPDTAEQDTEVLLRIHRELGGTLALDCEVLHPGRVAVGDSVEVREP